MPKRLDSSLRPVASPAKHDCALRTRLNSRGWRITHLADADADLVAVLDACRDPKLTSKMAALARAQAKPKGARSRALDGILPWLDQWNGEPSSVLTVATRLIDEIDAIDRRPDTEEAPPRSAEDVENVREVLLSHRDGETRLRKALLVLWGDADRVNNAFRYRGQRVKRRAQRATHIRNTRDVPTFVDGRRSLSN